MKERGINQNLNQEYFLTSSDFTDPVARTATNVLQNLGYSIHTEELFMRDGTPIEKGLVVYANKEAGEAYTALAGSADFSVTVRVISGDVIEESKIDALELLNEDEKRYLHRVSLESCVPKLKQQGIEQREQAEVTHRRLLDIMSNLQKNVPGSIHELLSHPDFKRYNRMSLNLLLESRLTHFKLKRAELRLAELGNDDSVDRDEMMGKIVGTILSSDQTDQLTA